MRWDWLRLAAIHYIATEGTWRIVGSNQLFQTNPLDIDILWCDQQLISHSKAMCIFRLCEVTHGAGVTAKATEGK